MGRLCLPPVALLPPRLSVVLAAHMEGAKGGLAFIFPKPCLEMVLMALPALWGPAVLVPDMEEAAVMARGGPAVLRLKTEWQRAQIPEAEAVPVVTLTALALPADQGL